MAQYIDKDALVAEIDKRKIGYNTDGKHTVEYNTVKKILDILDTLEVKEVDLDEEIEKCLKRHSMLAVGKKDFTDLAKHFFELGLKAQKGEKV